MNEELQEIVGSNPEWYQAPMTLEEIDRFIIANINTAKRSFIAIGYYLKYVRDRQLYKDGGFSGVLEYAKVKFGIGPSQASKYMSINDKFSVNGNSPILLEKYQEFDKTQLSEMLYLTSDQLEQVSVGMTKVEIREIGSPEKVLEGPSFSPAKMEPAPDDSEGSEQENTIDDLDLSVRTYNCMKRAGVDTVDELCSMTEDEVIPIRNISAKCLTEIKEKLAGIGRSLKTPAKKSNWEDGVFEDDCEGYGAFRAEAIDQFFGALNDRGLSPINMKTEEIHFRVWAYAYFAEQRDADYITFENEESGKDFKVAYQRIVNEFERYKANRPIPDNPPISVNDTPENVDNQPETVNDAEESVIETSESVIKEPETVIEQVETVEADIIQTVPEDADRQIDYEIYSAFDVQEEKDRLTEYVDVYRRNNDTVPGRRKAKMRLDAIALLAEEMQRPPVVEDPIPVQPELPILKNNDQRKAWAENYKAWGEWYYDEHIDCHYYKYDFPNGDRLVVEEYLNRGAYWGYEANRCHYHLLQKNKPAYEKNKTFEQKYVHTESSMTEIVEYLKDLQKK
ncbi:hypothetical protein HNQ56_003754 [Anaerotaenia torta]|uniref:DNA-directed RNA polymerase subunit alpha C-terminal domain-containing protein n=1 Tax=Anaerotaenia torta TaxID=433293 RepID=UPI003D2237FA